MGLKRVDGLQNLLSALDAAKHQYWSAHGVNKDGFQAAPDISQHFSSSTIHVHTACMNRSVPRASEQQISPSTQPFNASLFHQPAQSAAAVAEVKMVGLSKMDSSSLIAAALAPFADFSGLGKQVSSQASSKLVPCTPTPGQKVSPTSVI